MTTERLPDEQLIDLDWITRDSGMSDKWFYKLISQGRFMPPIKMGRYSRWKAGDYYAWKDTQVALSMDEFEKRRQQARDMAERRRVKCGLARQKTAQARKA